MSPDDIHYIRVNSRIQLEITQNHHSECLSAKLASELVNAYLLDSLLYSLHLRNTTENRLYN